MTKPFFCRLSQETYDLIKAHAGKNHYAEFIGIAVRDYLQRDSKIAHAVIETMKRQGLLKE
jgi:hypothetical protein